MKRQSTMAVLAFTICIWTAFNQESLIVEYISPFDLTVKDVEALSKDQLSRKTFDLSEFKDDNVTVSNLTFSTQYDGKDKSVEPKYLFTYSRGPSPKHMVNDSFILIVKYNAIVFPLTVKKHYAGQSTVKVTFSYTKELNHSTGAILFQNLKLTIDPNFIIKFLPEVKNTAHLKHLQFINNGTSNDSKKTHTILSLLVSQELKISTIQDYMTENILQSGLSETYSKNYTYSYSKINFFIDMSTNAVDLIDEGKGISNGMKATFTDNSIAFPIYETQPSHKEVLFHTLITQKFTQSFINKALSANLFKNLVYRQENFSRSQFRFKLIDLQFVFQSQLFEDYLQDYMRPIHFTCNLKQESFDGRWSVNQTTNLGRLDLTWSCLAYLEKSSDQQIFSFQLPISHFIEITTQNNRLIVRMKWMNLRDKVKFQGKYAVIDEELASTYLSQLFRYFQNLITIGTDFKVKEGSSQVYLKPEEGIFIL